MDQVSRCYCLDARVPRGKGKGGGGEVKMRKQFLEKRGTVVDIKITYTLVLDGNTIK